MSKREVTVAEAGCGDDDPLLPLTPEQRVHGSYFRQILCATGVTLVIAALMVFVCSENGVHRPPQQWNRQFIEEADEIAVGLRKRSSRDTTPASHTSLSSTLSSKDGSSNSSNVAKATEDGNDKEIIVSEGGEGPMIAVGTDATTTDAPLSVSASTSASSTSPVAHGESVVIIVNEPASSAPPPPGSSSSSSSSSTTSSSTTSSSSTGTTTSIKNTDQQSTDQQSDHKCLGFDKCPEYPRPYAFGEWPTSYSYEGSFPEGFVWGMGTSAYQVEGAYREDGRGASIWDTFTGANTVGMPGANCSYCCTAPPCSWNGGMADRGATGNVACDHYNNWRSDVALMQSMGLRHYRFSLSWPRLVPTGHIADGVNPQALAFYNGLIDALLGSGIEPYVTLYHWDLPQALLDPPNQLGWWSRNKATGQPDGQILPEWLAYVDACFKEFGDRIKFWFTFNEAWTFTFLASGFGKAPGIPQLNNMSKDPYIAGHNVLNAHAQAVDLYRRKYQRSQGGKIGITNNCDWREPNSVNPDDIAAAERAVEFSLGWFADPIFGGSGDYPPAMRRLFGNRLPNFTDEERRLLNGSSDYFGLNHYATGWAAHSKEPGADTAHASIIEEGLPQAASKWLFAAGWGLRKLVNWVDKRYGRPIIYVTEGGWSTDEDNWQTGLNDRQRLFYYANYTASLRQAIYKDGVDVRGYFAWSLMDNFEWERGYRERFGTTFNEFAFGEDLDAPGGTKRGHPTTGHQMRVRKSSSCWLEAVWTGNALVHPDGPVFLGCIPSTTFEGHFADAGEHSCLRSIIVDDGWKTGKIYGVDGSMGGPCDGRSDTLWGPFEANFSGGTVVADFSKHGGSNHLSGYWNRARGSIEWGDGRSWLAQSAMAGPAQQGEKPAKREHVQAAVLKK